MRTVVGIGTAMLLAITVTAAWAEPVQGRIKTVDATRRTFTLAGGTLFWVAEGLPMDRLKEGASVKAVYEERDGKKIVTSVRVAD